MSFSKISVGLKILLLECLFLHDSEWAYSTYDFLSYHKNCDFNLFFGTVKSANDKLYKLHNLLYLSSTGIILRHSKSLYINLLSGYQYTFYLQGQLSVHTAPWWNIWSLKLIENCPSNFIVFSIWYGNPPPHVLWITFFNRSPR